MFLLDGAFSVKESRTNWCSVQEDHSQDIMISSQKSRGQFVTSYFPLLICALSSLQTTETGLVHAKFRSLDQLTTRRLWSHFIDRPGRCPVLALPKTPPVVQNLCRRPDQSPDSQVTPTG